MKKNKIIVEDEALKGIVKQKLSDLEKKMKMKDFLSLDSVRKKRIK